MTTPNRPQHLSEVKPGDQLVKVHGSKGHRQPVIVAKVWKNGVIQLGDDRETYDPYGRRRGERSIWSTSPFLRTFNTDETPESIAADNAAMNDEAAQQRTQQKQERQQRLAVAVERNAENIARMVTVQTPTWGETMHILDYISRNDERKTAVFIVMEKTEIDWTATEGRRTYQALEARVAGAGYERMYDMDSEGNTVAGQKYGGFSSWSSITGLTMDEIIAQICDW